MTGKGDDDRVICYVETVKDRCRLCYTCILKCPSKAIRIARSQAEVIPERCIGCGNCVRNCSQGAKRVVSTEGELETLLARTGVRKVACVAPSFASEFCGDHEWRRVVGAIRALGFDLVTEVAFGADLVSNRYRALVESREPGSFIATTCPAVVGYVERYAPELIPALAPIVSPMIAMARALGRIYGPDIATAFIGPCIAKKVEAKDEPVAGEIDVVITFKELRDMLERRGIPIDAAAPSDFDPPRPGAGAIFPINRGILKSAGIREDILTGDIVVTDGTGNLVQSVAAFGRAELDSRLLEVLSCHGCVMGPGMTVGETQFRRASMVREYVRSRLDALDELEWVREVEAMADLDLSRRFIPNDRRLVEPDEDEIAEILARMGKTRVEDELNCGACGYVTCREHAVAIQKGIAETEMCLPFTIERLQTAVKELSETHRTLASVQDALVQSERLASMGQLAAGIAHELNNPLGVVLMYSNLLLEQAKDPQAAEDLRTIGAEAERCKRIVSGLLNFARRNKASAKPTRVPELVDGFLRMQSLPAGVELRVTHSDPDLEAEIDGDQIIQVLANLVSNAVAAMRNSGSLLVATRGDARDAVIEVTDSGSGIPQEHMKKLFSPFFTTKKLGQGTGLGLAVSYGIVKMHRGRIEVKSNADPGAGPTGTTFTLTLPLRYAGGDEQNAGDEGNE